MGSLHETNPSLWIATAPAPDDERFPPLGSGRRRADVVVVGAGITGLTAALALALQGASVVVLEAGRVCSGVTAYTTAKITSLHALTYASLRSNRGDDVARAYGEANEAAIAHIARWVDAFAIDCDFERRAAFTYTTDPSRVSDIESEVDAAVDVGLPAAFTVDTELPFEVAAAIRVEDQAQFHPRRYCLALADRVSDMSGCMVHERTRAVAVDGSSVRTDEATVEANHIVLASHLPFVDRGGFFAKTYPSRSYALAVTLAGTGEMPRGMYLGIDPPTRSVRTACSDSVLVVGGEGHKVGHDPDTRQRYEALEKWARDHFDVQATEHRWSAQDYVPVDGTPFVGRQLPGSNVLVATGFHKWGMTNGTAAALMITDVVAGRDNEWLFAFDATRVRSPVTSRALYTENVESMGRHFVAERLLPRRAHGPACSHMGCRLVFNTAERTWDCPCHGSRFTGAGAVIEGPAVADLSELGENGGTTS